MERYLIVILSSLVGGFVQSVTGFGAAILIMIFLPLIFPITSAPAVSEVITMTLTCSILWRYRKAVHIRHMFLPAIFYMVVCVAAVRQTAFLDTGKLKVLFGGFLVILAGYFLFFSGKFEIQASFWTSMCCAGLGGLCGGLFGISGPPVSLYYLAATKTKEEYLGNMNAFFFITVFSNLATRISQGFVTVELLPYMIAGIIAIQIGCLAGSKLSGRIDMEAMKKSVYGVMIFAGIISIVQGIGIFG